MILPFYVPMLFGLKLASTAKPILTNSSPHCKDTAMRSRGASYKWGGSNNKMEKSSWPRGVNWTEGL